jgi:hypothetical protein
MSLFFKKVQTKKPVGIVIIGSASIAGAIVSFDLDETGRKLLPRIAYVTNSDIGTVGETGLRDYFFSISKSLKNVLKQLHLGRDLLPERFHCFLSSPLYVGQTRVSNLVQNKPFRVSRKMIQELILKEAELYAEEQPLLYPEVIGDKNFIFENNLMQIKLNGYETNNPYDKLATKISWSQYISVGSKVIIEKLREIFHAENNLPVDFHSFTNANFFAFKDIMPDPDNFIIIDILGKLTDLVVVSEGILIEHSSYPLGLDKLVDRLAEELEATKEEARSILRMYTSKTINSNAKIQTAINTIKNEWLFSLRQGLNHVLESALLPETILLIDDDEATDLIISWLKDESLNNFTLSNNKLLIKKIKNDFFINHCLFDQDTKIDPALLAAAIFCAKI